MAMPLLYWFLTTVFIASTFLGSKARELETKLSGQQSGSVHANAEIDALKSRVAVLETEKRESLTALERKVSELDQVNEDYQAMSTRYQELKKEASKLESEAREAKASELNQKVEAVCIVTVAIRGVFSESRYQYCVSCCWHLIIASKASLKPRT